LKNKYIIIWRICINVLRIEVDTPETMTVGIGVDIKTATKARRVVVKGG